MQRIQLLEIMRRAVAESVRAKSGEMLFNLAGIAEAGQEADTTDVCVMLTKSRRNWRGAMIA